MKAQNKTAAIPPKLIKNWQAMIDALPHPVSIHDTRFNILVANQAFMDFCAIEDKKSLSRVKCYELIYHAKRPVNNCPFMETVRHNKQARGQIQDTSQGRHLLIHTSPFYHQGEIVGIIHSITDITELRASIDELTHREASLRRSRDAFFNMLEDINESYNELKGLFMSLVKALVNALDAKSPWTRGHSERVAHYAEQIARAMDLDENLVRSCNLAGLLHDIGKLGTYDYLLNKPESLTKEEINMIRQHPQKGVEILKGVKQLTEIIPYIKHHHERVDGRGYPDGLKGEDIPLPARILHVADSFDAMTTSRPYRPTPSREYALRTFKKYSGTQFDPRVIEAFLSVLEKKTAESETVP